eukprot:5530779-Pyramimonas_sp.AAC.1
MERTWPNWARVTKDTHVPLSSNDMYHEALKSVISSSASDVASGFAQRWCKMVDQVDCVMDRPLPPPPHPPILE